MKRLAVSCLFAAAVGAAAQEPWIGAFVKTWQAVPHPWAMKYSNPARTAKSIYWGADQGVVNWKYRTGGNTPGITVDSSGRIYLGATFNASSWNNEVYFNTLNSNGTIAWREKVTPYPWGSSQGVKSWPAIAPDRTIVFNSTNGELRKYSFAEQLVWTVPLNSNMTNDSAPAVLPDGSILHYQMNLRKFGPAGNLIWTANVGSQDDVAVAPNGDMAIGGIRTQEPHGSVDLTYINVNGSIRWSLRSANGSRGQTLFGPDGVLYYLSTAYNPDSTVRWTAPVGEFSALGTNGLIYAVNGSSVSAVNTANGTVAWTTPAGRSLNTRLAVDGRGIVYATSPDGYIFSFNGTTGAIGLQNRICTQFYTGPVIGTGRTVLAAGRDEGSREYFVYSIR